MRPCSPLPLGIREAASFGIAFMEAFLRMLSVLLDCSLAFFSQTSDSSHRRLHEFLANDDSRFNEIFDKDSLDALSQFCPEPSGSSWCWLREDCRDATILIPTDPLIADALLNNGAPKGGNTDYRVIGCGRVTNENHDRTAGHAPISCRPRVPKIPPNVRQYQTCLLTDTASFHEL